LSLGDRISAADFPAWLLLTEPGLIHQLPEDLAGGGTEAEQLYKLVHRLLNARSTQDEGMEIYLRKCLQETYPLLFEYMKACL
jgi:hypothetical protein